MILLLACAGTVPTPSDTAPTDTGHPDTVAPIVDVPLGTSFAGVVGWESSATGSAVAIAPDVLVVAAPFGGLTCAFSLPMAAGTHALDEGACLEQETWLDYAGGAVAVGDVNGDGTSDVLLGGVGNDELGPDAGKAWLVYGPITTGSLVDAPVSWLGEAKQDYAGSAVALLDVDGDGDDDVLVGAQANGGGGATAGRAYLFRAPVTGGFLGEADVTITGIGPQDPPPPPHGAPAVGDGVGSIVASAGDFDGDGLADMLLGANGADDGGTDAGIAAVFFGPIADGDHALRDADRVWYGDRDALYFGDSAATAGDLDADGYSDVMVGGDTLGAGTVWIFRGPGEVSDAQIVGAASGDLAGAYTAAAGDVDGDGWPDIVVGAYGVDTVDADEGAAYLVRGPFVGTMPLADEPRWLGESAGAEAGTAVAGGADADGDGVPDFVVGARYDATGGDFAGQAYVVAGGL